ncbi:MULTISPECIES: DUF6328 family protein [Gordonia]|uniref:DUF6328 family protein n=1 Tax=Gordonia amicalis TaxID=89053 RepID=A0AAE4R459_9ACTN|nr:MULTISPECIES: DUF6328 family protein [Gordonia]ATD72254.1 hypothetical protein CNO18_20295 [Gordonia sp. 1D]KAF0969441.1 hypothetical protein BPODLACK_02234 [Gordonia sp. YY1]MCR8895943.1 DUF6328 family protein [Gordonia sp. GONU]MCZ4578663.1 DUF6328 family protein [Gordonia amicalis]MCZ4651501.1 DUF6328 family protein [Gordonia amicalis]
MAHPTDTEPPTGHPGADDAAWNRAERDETETQRLDRNWNSLLQELRVVQTGVQILTGFLLTMPFQSRFEDLGGGLRVVYLITVSFAVGAAILLAAPVALHRALFRRHQLALIVALAHYMAFAGLTLLGLALSGAITVVFGATAGPVPAVVAGCCTFVVFSMAWIVLPLTARGMTDPPDDDATPRERGH